MKTSRVYDLALMPFFGILRLVESFLFVLVRWYDNYCYSPLQTFLWPWVEQVPRFVEVKGRKVNVFTANIVTWSRTLLVIPIAYTLKYQCYWSGFACVLFHDFLDHLDGIVAKVHRHQYGPCDDPIVGGFMDAFCDKIVNVLSLWSILMVTDFTSMTSSQSLIYFLACAVIISYEFTLGVVRVQDFFRAFYLREFKKTDHRSSKTSTAAVMEGKLKEKLESMGIAALCLAQGNPVVLDCVSGVIGVTCLVLSVRLAHSSLSAKLHARAPQIRSQLHASDDEDEMKTNNNSHNNPHSSTTPNADDAVMGKTVSNAGCQTERCEDSIIGKRKIEVSRSAKRLSRHNSVDVGDYDNIQQRRLGLRQENDDDDDDNTDNDKNNTNYNNNGNNTDNNNSNNNNHTPTTTTNSDKKSFTFSRTKSLDNNNHNNNNHDDDKTHKIIPPTGSLLLSDDDESLTLDLKRCASSPETAILKDCGVFDTRAERVYTIGCFDLFHHGHVTLLERMRTLAKKVVVGVHDSRSIYQLKNRVPIDSTMVRMRNVRQFADEVFCVAGTDPTPFIDCIFDSSHSITSALYVRGDDMPHFPARHLCERLMTVKFLPYTPGVSSTKLRKDLLNSSSADKYRLDENSNDLHMFY